MCKDNKKPVNNKCPSSIGAGAIAGIVIAALIVVGGVAGLAAYFICKSKRATFVISSAKIS